MQSSSAADAGNFRRTREDAAEFDDDIDIGSAQSSLEDFDFTWQHDDPYFPAQFKYTSLNDKYVNYVNPVPVTKRRKPPEYVGYAANAGDDFEERGQSTKSNQDLTPNNTGPSGGVGHKTNDNKLPVGDELHGYGWTTDEDGEWRSACRELNCVEGSACVPDTLHGRRPRCQCPLGTDGDRCQRRTSSHLCNLLTNASYKLCHNAFLYL